MQAVLAIETLSDSGLDAGAAFHADYLAEARALLERDETTALAIVLPAAGPEHDDWRRAIARDLARAYSPKRVNVVGAGDPQANAEVLAYLRDAPGVTGQYLATHE